MNAKENPERESVVAVYESLDQAKDAVRALEQAGFPPEQVSLVTRSLRREMPGDEERVVEKDDKAETDARQGAALGGLVGLLLGAPLLMIPGVGAVLLAGPIATALTGAIVGGFLGSMAGWGVPEDAIDEYQQRVREGEVLVIAHGDPLTIARADRLLQATSAREVKLHATPSDSSVDR
jgi:hypothetical protein